MLTEALEALATAGGTAVVSAAGTEIWQQLRTRVARLLGRGEEASTTLVNQRLDRTYAELQAASAEGEENVRAALVSAWTTRLTDLLEERPQVAAEVRALVELVTTNTHIDGVVQQHIVGYGQARQAVQGHGYQVNVFGAGPDDA